MFLYDNKGKTLDVYEFSANENDLKDYRTEEMLKRYKSFSNVPVYDAIGRGTRLFEHYTGDDKILTSEGADNYKRLYEYGQFHVLVATQLTDSDRSIS